MIQNLEGRFSHIETYIISIMLHETLSPCEKIVSNGQSDNTNGEFDLLTWMLVAIERVSFSHFPVSIVTNIFMEKSV